MSLIVTPSADPRAESILDAALEQFADVGIRRSSVDDVARGAGVSRMTVFRRFGSKDELVRAVISREIQRAVAALDDVWGEASNTSERLLQALQFGVRFVSDHPLFSRLLASEPDDLLPQLTVDGAPLLGLYRSLITERLAVEQARGEIDPPDLEVAAEVIARLALSLVLTPSESGSTHLDRLVRDGLMPMLRPAA